MRILVVLSRVPYPLEKGDKLRAYHMIRELSARHDIYLFCLSDKRVHPDAEEKLKKHCSEVYIHRIPWFTKLMKMVGACFSNKPFQVEYFHSSKAQQAFNTFLEAHIPQHIFCQLIRTSEFAKGYRTIPKTLDYMDAFSAGMKRMEERAKWPISFLMKIEQRRLARYEQSISEYFDHLLIISEQDRACLNGVGEEIEVIPNGIDPSFFHEEEIPKTRDVLFCGNMSYRPNVESARFLVNEVMPLVWQKRPGCKVTIAGANPSSVVRQLESANVEITGWVERIDHVYRSAQVFVAPMLINSGLQNKLLEAMALEVPCITTSLANNALGAEHDKTILIADQAEEMASQIIRLLDNGALSEQLSKEGKKFVLQHFSWPHEAKRLEQIMHLT